MSTKTLPKFPLLLHTTAVSVMTYGYIHLPDVTHDIPLANMKGGHFQFLTIQGLCVAWLTMVLSIGCDLVPSARILKSVKRAFLMSALPLAIVISVIYWSLLLTVPHLILMKNPNTTEPTSSSNVPDSVRLPLHTDLALHAAPAISLFIDFYFLERRYSNNASRYGSPVLAAVVGTWYACWVEYCASHNGVFPYPFLTNSPFNARAAIYVGATAFATFAFMVLNALHP